MQADQSPNGMNLTLTFIPRGCHIIEPLLHTGNSMGGIFVAAPGYLGDCGHGAFQSSTGLGDHGVMAQMKVQGLHNVRGVFTGTCIEGVGSVGWERGKKKSKRG